MLIMTAPWDAADGMCPNCVTPWKCNGPHLADQTPYARRALVTADEPTGYYEPIPEDDPNVQEEPVTMED